MHGNAYFVDNTNVVLAPEREQVFLKLFVKQLDKYGRQLVVFVDLRLLLGERNKQRTAKHVIDKVVVVDPLSVHHSLKLVEELPRVERKQLQHIL